MGRKRTATVEARNGKWYVKLTVTLDNGKTARRKVPIPGAKTREEAEARKLRIAAKAEGRTFAANTAPTVLFRDYVEKLWLPARERRGLKALRKDRERLRGHVIPLLGDLAMQDIGKEELRGLVEELDRKIHDSAVRFAWKTGRHVWMLTKKLFADSCRSKVAALRVLVDNPCDNVAPPDRGPDKAKQWLYPSEFTQLVTCKDVPLRWRRIYSVATLLFIRWGEARALAYRDLDLVHHTAHVHEQLDDDTGEIRATKTADVRDVPLEPTLLPLLKAMRLEDPDGERLFASIDKPSQTLREHLLIAKVERSALHRNTSTSLAMRFHDLRATGITWMALRGDSALRIRERAGHAEFSQTEEYIRRAELVGSNVGSPFPELPTSLLRAVSSPNNVPGIPSPVLTNRNRVSSRVRRGGLELPQAVSSSHELQGFSIDSEGTNEHETNLGTIEGTLFAAAVVEHKTLVEAAEMASALPRPPSATPVTLTAQAIVPARSRRARKGGSNG